ncbi:hypothetical protein R1sor_014236 [Riccia sorocarpa]|uniref:Uncharacterized protein n=1 Tax=Riccia sorocarpa TaxID=122646 RepID=A0ABD3HBU6_9MARC
MVESQVDSVGPSPVLKNEERLRAGSYVLYGSDSQGAGSGTTTETFVLQDGLQSPTERGRLGKGEDSLGGSP